VSERREGERERERIRERERVLFVRLVGTSWNEVQSPPLSLSLSLSHSQLLNQKLTVDPKAGWGLL